VHVAGVDFRFPAFELHPQFPQNVSDDQVVFFAGARHENHLPVDEFVLLFRGSLHARYSAGVSTVFSCDAMQNAS
jgi:hypothetical protein